MRHAHLTPLIALMLSTAGVLGAPAESAVAALHAAEASHVAGIHAKAASLDIDLAAAPAWLPVPELGLEPIQPGPGLPSLESLGMTWAALIEPRGPEMPVAAAAASGVADGDALERRGLERRYTPTCKTGAADAINYNNGILCFNYLSGLGSTSCVVNSSAQFCVSGATRWQGWSQSGTWDSTTCKQVADGGRWVLDHCCNWVFNFGWINREGTNAAWNKENIIVRIYE